VSCVLYADDVRPLDAIDLAVTVDDRIATGTMTCAYGDPGPGGTLAVALPDGARVVGVRLREAGGDWLVAGAVPAGSADTLPDGDAPGDVLANAWTIGIPDLGGPIDVEVTWQALLAARDGAIELAIPLDDGGLDPSDPPVTATIDVHAARPILTTSLVPGAASDGHGSWGGLQEDAPALELAWTEEPALGVRVLAYRPDVDPFTGIAGQDGYGLAIVSPGVLDDTTRVPRLFTFVLDTSSSMAGEPLEAAVAAGEDWLDQLDPADRFDVVAFGSQARPWRGRAPYADSDAVDDASAFLERQRAMGLSDPAEALVSALEASDDTLQQRDFLGCGGTARGEAGDLPPELGAPITTEAGRNARMAAYVVLLTDGGASAGITDPNGILAAVADADTVGATIDAIGLGGGADRELLTALANAHRGDARFAATPDDVGPIVDELVARIGDPLLVRPKLLVLLSTEAAPAVLPDVPAGTELMVAFRYTPGDSQIFLQAVHGQDDLAESWPVGLPEHAVGREVVATVWAQLRVTDLDAAYAAGNTSVYAEIQGLVRDYGVASDVVGLGFDGDADTDFAGAMDYADSAGCGCGSGRATGWIAVVAAVVMVRRRVSGARTPDSHGARGI
jgi:hypothetical protein